MIITEQQHSQLEKVVRPVIEWLRKNCNPHTSIIVDTTNAELVEGIASVGTKVSRVDAEVSENMAEIDGEKTIGKQAFYVKAKIQSKEDLKCVFVTDHLVHLGDLPITEIEHAITDEIQRRIKEREEDKYEILAIEKIILALDNPPEM